MRLVLLGSPDLAVSTFKVLVEHFSVVAFITQPDRQAGRGLMQQQTAVATFAQSVHLPVYKPQRIDDLYTELSSWDFDLMLTFAYGQLIPDRILNLGRFKPLNIHASLLPKYRGAAPIQAAVFNGDSEIGISLMQMVKQMDAGPILFQAAAALDTNASTVEAMHIVSQLASEHIVEWLKAVFTNKVRPIEQSGSFTLAPKLSVAAAQISEQDSCAQALRKIKAFNPKPGAWVVLNQQRVKVFDAVTRVVSQAPVFACADGLLYFTDYQFESRKRIKIAKV